MPQLNSALSLTATRRAAHALLPALVAVALGCRDGADAPTGPDRTAAVEAAPAATLSFRQVSVSPGLGGGVHTCGVTTDNVAPSR